MKIPGIHHITAVASDAQRNYDFYTKVLGLRLVKKTVNFDDPGTYHLYYGNETGVPGTILTFFPWTNINPGYAGTGMGTMIGYSVPRGSLEFWSARFKEHQIRHSEQAERFEERFLSFEDPDGLKLNLIEPKDIDSRTPWETVEIKSAVAIKGLHSIVLTLKDMKPTAEILTELFGYKLLAQEGNYYRFATDAATTARTIDLLELPDERAGYVAGGTIHHVAFRVKDREEQLLYRDRIAAMGLNVTPQIDRNYFYSVYFREPGGVLFEIATDEPGFTVDEPVNELGMQLKLPVQYEKDREVIEKTLPALKTTVTTPEKKE
jgi:glyoxalase family protein